MAEKQNNHLGKRRYRKLLDKATKVLAPLGLGDQSGVSDYIHRAYLYYRDYRPDKLKELQGNWPKLMNSLVLKAKHLRIDDLRHNREFPVDVPVNMNPNGVEADIDAYNLLELLASLPEWADLHGSHDHQDPATVYEEWETLCSQQVLAQEALMAMSDRQRFACQRVIMEGASPKKVAEKMGISVWAVYALIKEGLRKARRKLGSKRK